MIIPAAMFIESAIDSLKDGSVPQSHLDAQLKEFRFALGSPSEDMQRGYQLGLQTARVLLQGMPAAVFAKVEI